MGTTDCIILFYSRLTALHKLNATAKHIYDKTRSLALRTSLARRDSSINGVDRGMKITFDLNLAKRGRKSGYF